jgi:hypothetical protein
MRKSSIAGAFAFIIMAVSTTANAAVKYEFTAFSTFPTGVYTSVSGSFTYIAPDFVTSNTFIAPADLASCSASDSVLNPLTCSSQGFAFDVSPPQTTILFGVSGPQDTSFDYYFDPTAFSTVGVHDTVFFGTDQAAQLAVSEVSSVPEISTWAMMLLGFAGLGCAGYRRARRSYAAFAA